MTSSSSSTAFRPPLLATDFHHTKEHDLSHYIGWYMSEKLDGVRCLYFEDKLYSRTGHPIHAPGWFLDCIRERLQGTGITALDGELYTQRADFQRLSGIIRKKVPVDTEWRQVVYMVFDLPLDDRLVFRERYQKMLEHIPLPSSLSLQILPHVTIKSIGHIQGFLRDVVSKNGEGIMLRDAESFYEYKRSKTLVKYKEFLDDDATVIAVEKGRGKYLGKIGAFRVKWVERPHIEFRVGTGMDDTTRSIADHHSLIDRVVKVKYYSITNKGVPRFPVFMGFREDAIILPRGNR